MDIVPTFTCTNNRITLLLKDKFGLIRIEDAERLQVSTPCMQLVLDKPGIFESCVKMSRNCINASISCKPCTRKTFPPCWHIQGFPEGYTEHCWPLEENLLRNATQRNHGNRKPAEKTKKEHDRRRHALLGNAVTVEVRQSLF